MIKTIKEYALINDIPIIEDDVKLFLEQTITNNHAFKILEIGSAIGYSAICMANVNDNVQVTTIERDLNRYTQAVSLIKEYNLQKQITIINEDALDIDVSLFDNDYDLLFIDAAKAQSKRFLLKYDKLLKDNGLIIIDNINFHGFANGERISTNRNTRQLIRKINDFKAWLENNQAYKTEYFDIGDGLLFTHKR